MIKSLNLPVQIYNMRYPLVKSFGNFFFSFITFYHFYHFYHGGGWSDKLIN